MNKKLELIDLWFNPKTTLYYHKEGTICESCEEEIMETLVHIVNWGKKSSIQKYCMNCHNKTKESLYIVREIKICSVKAKIPKGCIPVFVQPPQLANTRGLHTSQVGEIMRGSEAEIIDNTKFFGREGYTFQISDSRDFIPISEFQAENKLLEQRDAELGDNVATMIVKQKEALLQIAEVNKDKSLTWEEKLRKERQIKESVKVKEVDVDSFFEQVISSELLLTEIQEVKKIEESPEMKKKRELEDQQEKLLLEEQKDE